MAERVLVVNAGSSSLKVKLVDPVSGAAAATALVERLGSDDAVCRTSVGSHRSRDRVPAGDVADALALIRSRLTGFGVDLSADPPVAVGHRVVHGGPSLTAPVRVDERVIAAIEEAASLAPLHNPANLAGIRAALRSFPDLPHVAVFDTAFFAALPAAASTYALDRQVCEQHHIRRYGFQGTSHEFVSAQTARHLGRDVSALRQIVLHLGNGASASAIDRGRPIDTSMGLTPLEGLVMGTRPGDLDAGILVHLARNAGYDVDGLDELISRRSGLLGLTGHSDMRDVVRAAQHGDRPAALALDVVAHRLRKYIGAYLAVLGGLDAITFTAGVGENSPHVRALALDGLAHLGISVDPLRNTADSSGPRVISPDHSPVTVLVVPTDEELAIARHAVASL